MEWPHYGATFYASTERRASQVELLDDESAGRHDLLHDVCGWILFGAVCLFPLGLRFAQMAGGNLQNARNQFTGGVSPARCCFVVDFTMVSEKLRASRCGNWLCMLQRICLWRLRDNGTSRMADPGLAEHCHMFVVPTSVGTVA